MTPTSVANSAARLATGLGLSLITLLPARHRRRALASLQASVGPQNGGGTPSQAGGVPVTWINPELASRATIVYLHGGGYIAGPVEDQWNWITRVSASVGCAAAVVLYRMPPDHPHPAAMEDALTAIRAIPELSQTRWILAGDSAGGGLAITVAHQLREASEPLPTGLVLTAPWVDLTLGNPDIRMRGDFALNRGWLGRAARLYAAGRPLSTIELSPIHGSFERFPPTHLNVGDVDPFAPDVRLLVKAMRRDGIAVTFIEQPGGVHTYSLYETEDGIRTTHAQVDWLRGILDLTGAPRGSAYPTDR